MDPLGAGWVVGSVAALILGVLVLTVIGAGAEQILWAAPRGLFRVVRLSRVPVASSALLLFLLPGLIARDVPYHAARVVGGSGPPRTVLALDDLADAFRKTAERASADTVPLFVIATAGGGARAAYWTLLAENCVFAGAPPEKETLSECDGQIDWSKAQFVSGISGGSVGLAMFESNQLAGKGEVTTEGVFKDGFLDPTMAAMVFRDAANVYFRYERSSNLPSDRAGILERAWEIRLPSIRRKFFASELRGSRGDFPLLMLNSASVGDGCRINVSVADLATTRGAESRGPLDSCRLAQQPPRSAHSAGTPLVSTRDVVDFVCSSDDLLMSTAALLSARFPFVSPTGSLDACGRKGDTATRIYAVDGGYVDSSGASPLAELIPPFIEQVERTSEGGEGICVQPVVLQIDNGYADFTATRGAVRPGELKAPLAGQGAVSGARADAARQALDLVAQPRCPSVSDPTYLHLFPDSRPGIEAPLGWSLSKASRRDLRQQLTSSRNRQVLCLAKRWLGSQKSCPALRPEPRHEQPAVITLTGFDATPYLGGILAVFALLTLLTLVWSWLIKETVT